MLNMRVCIEVKYVISMLMDTIVYVLVVRTKREIHAWYEGL